MRRFSRQLVIAITATLIPAGIAFAQVVGDPVKGKASFPVCTACHGVKGLGNQAMAAPKLAGQSPSYLLRQMQLFQTGGRGTAAGDMQGRQMAAMSNGPGLATEEGLRNMVAYITSLPDASVATTVTGDVARGAQLYLTCAACHGAQGEGLEAMAGPRLQGQNDWYLVSQLKKFKSGKRVYAPSDHRGRQMQAMLGVLANDDDINSVVAHINTFEPLR